MQPGAAALLQITSWTPHINVDRVATGLTPTPTAPRHGGALSGLPPAAGNLRACRHFCRAWDGGRRRTRKLAHAGTASARVRNPRPAMAGRRWAAGLAAQW